MSKLRRAALGFSLVLSVLFFSCGSTSGKTSSDGEDEVTFNVQRNSSRTYFSAVSQDVMNLVQDGSAVSLRQAASLLHKTAADEYSVQEKVLLNTMAQIMQIVWPSEQISWDVPEVTEQNPYSGAIDSARRGIYDSSTGNSDFLTIVLPSLILATSAQRTDYFPQAEEALMQALNIKSDSVLVNYLLGLLKLKQESFQNALSFFNVASKNSGDSFELKYETARTLYLCGNYKDSLLIAERLTEKNAQNIKLLELSTLSAFESGDLEKAESYVVRVLLLEPENMEFVLMRAKILIARGEYIRASSLLDVYSRSDINSKDYLLLRAKLQRDWNKNNTAAGETVSRALSYYPEDEEVLLLAAEIAGASNSRLGGLSSLELAQKTLEKNPSSKKAMQISIAEMVKAGQWNLAWEMSSQLVKSPDATLELKQNHIDICLALKNNTEAFNLASKLYESNPQDENVQQSYIKVLAATNQRGPASQLIAALMPDASSRMKSFLYYQRSFFAATEDAVLSDLRSSLTANPRNQDALYRLYEIYYGKKDWRRAQYYLKQVVALDPQNPSILSKNAELDALLGK